MDGFLQFFLWSPCSLDPLCFSFFFLIIGGTPKKLCTGENTLKVHIWSWLDTCWHLMYSVRRMLARDNLPSQFKDMLRSFQDSSNALKSFLIVITDILKYVFINSEDLAFSTNIRIFHDHMHRSVCFSHYPDAGFLTFGNMVSFSSAQFVLFIWCFSVLSPAISLWSLTLSGGISWLLLSSHLFSLSLSHYQNLYS